MAKLTWKDLENAGRKIGSEVGNAARKVNTVMTGTRAASTGASNYAGQKSSVKQAPRARMKKYNDPMEVKQSGPSQFTKMNTRGNNTSATSSARNTVNAAVVKKNRPTAGARSSSASAAPVAKQAEETARKSRPASERFAEISQRAAARRSDETNAAIAKNQKKNEWKVSKQNNSGSYKAMMQNRTQNAMQRASQKNLANRPTSSTPSRQSQDIDSYRQEYERLTRQTVRGNAQQRDKATKARKAYEEAFKRDHPDIDFETIRGKKKGR